MSRRWSILALTSVLLALLASCGVDAEPYEPPTAADLIESPDELARVFEAAYEAMDTVAYERLLHDQYAMPLQVQVAASYPDLGPAIERDESLRIHERLFSREPCVDPNQQPVVAVEAIAFQSLQKLGPWVEAGPSDAYPGTLGAGFEVELLLDRGAARTILKVGGTLHLHVAVIDTTVNGSVRQHHQLRAITDLTYDSKAVEYINLGRLLGLWR